MIKLVQFKFNSTVNFVKNNEIITASRIQKFSTHVTMNELLTNNGLNIKYQDMKIFNLGIPRSFPIFDQRFPHLQTHIASCQAWIYEAMLKYQQETIKELEPLKVTFTFFYLALFVFRMLLLGISCLKLSQVFNIVNTICPDSGGLTLQNFIQG